VTGVRRKVKSAPRDVSRKKNRTTRDPALSWRAVRIRVSKQTAAARKALDPRRCGCASEFVVRGQVNCGTFPACAAAGPTARNRRQTAK
jgi:hypothetical protein